MIRAGALEKGMFLLVKSQPHLVADREFVNPGKGSAFVRVKLKNLITGQVLRETFKSNESISEAEVYERPGQYLYADETGYHFMDTESYEQFTIANDAVGDKGKLIKEGDTYRVIMWESEPIDIQLPYKVVYTVTEAQEAVRGDSVTGGTKNVTVETGLDVKVPLFIKQGDKVLVNTETGEYVERVND